MLRLLKFLIVWLVNPNRRPEAKAKIEAYPKILLLGLAARPDEPPDKLRRESTDFNFVPAGIPRWTLAKVPLCCRHHSEV